MKTNEFLQTVNATLYVSGKLNNLNEIILQIDELRKLHVRLQQKLESFLSDPFSYESNDERIKIRNTAQEIKNFATEYKILVSFFKLPNSHEEFRNLFKKDKTFATYWYKSVQITDLIVFKDYKTKKNINKKVEQIREISFPENHEELKVLDENGVDINKIPGVDL